MGISVQSADRGKPAGEPGFENRKKSAVQARKGRLAPPHDICSVRCLVVDRDLGEGRAAYFVAQNLRSPFDDVTQGLQHLRVRSAAVLLSLVLGLPKADGVGLVPA